MIKITKREEISKGYALMVRLIAIVGALFFTGIFISILGYNPIKVFSEMFFGAIGTPMRIEETLNKAAPLIITSLGILVAFKMKFWNIGGEGQIIMGALGASYIALNYADTLPKPILLLLMILAAIILGGIWALIPALFKVKLGTNETIFTLMLNYVGIKIVQYLQFGPWKDPSATGFPKIPTFADNAIINKISFFQIGWIIAIILTVIMYFFVKYM